MTRQVTKDDLVLYLDGELDVEANAEVEAALARDASLRATLASLSEGTALLRAAFAPARAEAAGDPVAQRIEAMMATATNLAKEPVRVAHQPGFRRWWIPAAVAASVAVIAAGLGGGYLISDARVTREIARLEAAQQQDRQAFELALQQALETQLSGTSVAWQGTDANGTITPIRTFKSADGQWCREYLIESAAGAAAERQHAIACRTPEGGWKTRLPVLVES